MGARRKYIAAESGDSERGMLMYTTLILILITFFVVLVSRANFDESKYYSAVTSIRRSFGSLDGGRVAVGVEEGLPDQSLGFDQGGQLVLPEMEMSQIRALLAPALMNREASIIHSGGKRVVSLSAGLLFAFDSADIRPEVRELLTALAEIIAVSGASVAIEGHTDNTPPQNSGAGDNWDLSGRQALAVMEFLSQAGGIKADLLTPLAYAGSKPLHSNATPQGRARNKRVDLVLDFSGRASSPSPSAEEFDRSYNFQGFDFLLKNNFGESQ